MKTFPACWRASKTADHSSVASNRRSFKSSGSKSTADTESQCASQPFLPKCLDASSDASPENAANCRSPVQNITVTEPCATLKIGGNPSASFHKLNLDDYRRRHTKSSSTPVDSCKSTLVADGQESDRSLPGWSESAAEVVNMSATNTSAAPPRVKLKIGSRVVTKSVASPEKPSTDVHTSYVMQNTMCNDTSLSGQYFSDAPVACANGDAFEDLNLLTVGPSVKSARRVSSSSSYSCEDENSNVEPPSKRARVSFSQQFSSTAD